MKTRKVTVEINRGQGAKETFEGIIKSETIKGYYVTYKTNDTIGEWFPKESQQISCYETTN